MKDKKTVTKTVTITLNEYEFHCDKCDKIHTKSAYAIAQITMGHLLTYSCDCGNEIEL